MDDYWLVRASEATPLVSTGSATNSSVQSAATSSTSSHLYLDTLGSCFHTFQVLHGRS